jgi:hypothetical protein
MIKGKTTDGFKFAVDEDVLKDFMFLKYLNMCQSKKPEEALDGTIKIVSCIFNDDDKEREFYEFLKAKHNGRVPVDVLSENVRSIILKLKENNELKKS